MKKIIFLTLFFLFLAGCGFALESIVFINLTVYGNDTSILNDYGVREGVARSMVEGDYSYKVFDSEDNEILGESFALNELMFYDNATVLIRFPYTPETAKVEIYHGGVKLQEIDLELCNHDGNCSGRENFLSCPEDCPPGSQDGYCDMIRDTRIDPDCYEGEDPDEYCNYNGECEKDIGENKTTCPADCNPTALRDVVVGLMPENETNVNETVESEEGLLGGYGSLLFIGIVLIVFVVVVLVAVGVFFLLMRKKKPKRI